MHQYHTLLTILGLLETVIFITDCSFSKVFYIVFSSSVCFYLIIYWYTMTHALSQASLTLTFSMSHLSSPYVTRPIPKHTWPLCLSHTHPITIIWLLVQDLSLFSVLMAISSTLPVFASPRPLYRVPLSDKLGCYSAGPKETLVLPKEGSGLACCRCLAPQAWFCNALCYSVLWFMGWISPGHIQLKKYTQSNGRCLTSDSKVWQETRWCDGLHKQVPLRKVGSLGSNFDNMYRLWLKNKKRINKIKAQLPS